MRALTDGDRVGDAADAERVRPVRVLDVSFRGRSWQLHDVGRATWLVYPWGWTGEVWGRFHAVEWADRATRWEAINRIGEIGRFGAFADAAMFACVLPDRMITIEPSTTTRAVERLTQRPSGRGSANSGPGR